MTATPLADDIILDQIKHIDRLNIEWSRAVPIKLNVIDTKFTNKELSVFLNLDEDCNYHIFLNSVRTIRDFILKNKLTNYKVVCSETSARNNRVLNIESTKSPPKKFNFYTSSSFEGCDIFDEKGKTIVICDTNKSTTILDISTLIRQICGRLRDSIYKDHVTLILNTKKHRYAGVPKEVFDIKVLENIKLGKYTEHKFNTDTDEEYRNKELRSFTKEAYNSFYVNMFDKNIFFDDNLRKMDEYNFKLVSEIYESSISVLLEINNTEGLQGEEATIEVDWVRNKLKKDAEYSFDELKVLLAEEFEKRNIQFDGRNFKYYFPTFTKKIKTKNKIRSTYYKFEF